MNKPAWLLAGACGALCLGAGLALGYYAGHDGVKVTSTASQHGVDSTPTASAPPPSGKDLGASLVQVEPVQTQVIRDMLRINGKLALNGTRIHQLSARLAGRIDSLQVVEGSSVQAGQVVAQLYSPEYISAQNELLLARNTVRALSTKATADLLEDAQATLAGARQKLRVLGASDAAIAQLERSGAVQQHLALVAPISGRVIKRNIDPGGYLDAGASLGTIADMSSLWFLGNVFEADLPRIRERQEVSLQVAGLPSGSLLRGRVSFISPFVDPQTHTVNLRVELPNPGGVLRPDMFARADVDVGEKALPVVPRGAVVQDGAESYLMVERTPGQYTRVAVDVVPGNDPGHLAVTRGLTAGDRVVIEGSVLVERMSTSAAGKHGTEAATPAQAAGQNVRSGS